MILTEVNLIKFILTSRWDRVWRQLCGHVFLPLWGPDLQNLKEKVHSRGWTWAWGLHFHSWIWVKYYFSKEYSPCFSSANCMYLCSKRKRESHSVPQFQLGGKERARVREENKEPVSHFLLCSFLHVNSYLPLHCSIEGVPGGIETGRWTALDCYGFSIERGCGRVMRHTNSCKFMWDFAL